MIDFQDFLEYVSTYLLPCYWLGRSIEFDMQHNHIPKTIWPQFYPLCSPGDQTEGFKLKYHLIHVKSIVPLPAKRLNRFGKKLPIDLLIEKFK